jgi:hypothetical protein
MQKVKLTGRQSEQGCLFYLPYAFPSKHPRTGFLTAFGIHLSDLVMPQRSEASTLGFLTAFGMNCDEKTKFQVLFKCSLTTRLCSQTELAVG